MRKGAFYLEEKKKLLVEWIEKADARAINIIFLYVKHLLRK